jgi:hypothetical protein
VVWSALDGIGGFLATVGRQGMPILVWLRCLVRCRSLPLSCSLSLPFPLPAGEICCGQRVAIVDYRMYPRLSLPLSLSLWRACRLQWSVLPTSPLGWRSGRAQSPPVADRIGVKHVKCGQVGRHLRLRLRDERATRPRRASRASRATLFSPSVTRSGMYLLPTDARWPSSSLSSPRPPPDPENEGVQRSASQCSAVPCRAGQGRRRRGEEKEACNGRSVDLQSAGRASGSPWIPHIASAGLAPRGEERKVREWEDAVRNHPDRPSEAAQKEEVRRISRRDRPPRR